MAEEAKEVKVVFSGDASGLRREAKGSAKAFDQLADKAEEAAQETVKVAEAVEDTGEAAKELGGKAREGFGRVSKGADGATQATRRTAEETKRTTAEMGRLARAGRTLASTGRFVHWGSEKLVNQYTALAGGAGIGLATKKAMEFNAQLTMMGVNARDAQNKINGQHFAAALLEMRGQIKGIAQELGQSPEELLAAMNAIVERTGDIEAARAQLHLMAVTARATGASLEDVGALVSNLGEKAGFKGPEQMREALEILVAQGKAGAFTLKDLSSQGERVLSVFPQLKKEGSEGLRVFGALLQMTRKSSGSAETAAEGVEGLFGDLSNVKELQRKIKAAGLKIQIFDRKKNKRATESIIRDIIVAAKGDFDKIAPIFGDPAQRVLRTLANEYAAGRGFAMYDSFKNVDAGGGMLDKDAATNLATASGQVDRFIQTLRSMSDDWLVGPLERFNQALAWINDHGETTKAVLAGIGASLGTLAGIVLLGKTVELVREGLSALGVGGKKGVGALAGAGGSDGKTHVWVDNLPAGGLGGGLGGDLPGGPGGKPGTQAAKAGRGLLARMGGFTARIFQGAGEQLQKRGMGGLARGARRGGVLFGRGLPAAGRWLGATGRAIGASRPMSWLGAALSKGAGLGRGILGVGGNMLKGSLYGAIPALLMEYALNGFSMRSTVGAAASLLGGSLGTLVGGIGGLGVASVPAALALGAGGSIGARWAALSAYDALFGTDPKLQQAAGQALAATPSSSRAPVVVQPTPITQTLHIGVNVDSTGRATSQVSGPGSSDIRVLPQTIGTPWGALGLATR